MAVSASVTVALHLSEDGDFVMVSEVDFDGERFPTLTRYPITDRCDRIDDMVQGVREAVDSLLMRI